MANNSDVAFSLSFSIEGFSLRVTTPSRACEPVLEVETDLAGSGVQSGSVSISWLVILPMADYHTFASQRVGTRASRV